MANQLLGRVPVRRTALTAPGPTVIRRKEILSEVITIDDEDWTFDMFDFLLCCLFLDMARIRLVFSIDKRIGEHSKGNSFENRRFWRLLLLKFYSFVCYFLSVEMSEEEVPTFRKPKKKPIQTRTKVEAEDLEEDIS